MNGVETIDQEKILGRAIAKARKKAGFTQQSLCAAANLSYSTLAKIERGAIRTPSVFTVAAIANATGTTIEALTGAITIESSKRKYKTAKNGIKFVYFDVNGVLVSFYQRAFTNIAADIGVSPDAVEEVYWRYNDAVCRGEMDINQFDAKLAEKLGVRTISWSKYYLDCIEPIKEMRDSIIWVAKDYRVGLLSNIMPGLLSTMIDRGLLPNIEYQAIIDSSIVGSIKPEKAIYKKATEASGVNPSEIFFIDDSRANIMAADKFGWKVLWFDDYRPNETSARIQQALE